MKTKPAIHQVMETCSYGDAIGNMGLNHRAELRKAGYISEIYAGKIHPLLSGDVKTIPQFRGDPKEDDIIIYHFSIGSNISRLVHSLPNRLVLYYHNITPPEFFRVFHDVLMRQFLLGREELKTFAQRTDLAVADSDYNRLELVAYGFRKTATLPVTVNRERLLKNHNISVEKMYRDRKANFLFVGRVIPNKKVEDVIKAFHLYKRQYNPASRLFITGSYKSFEGYLDWLRRLVKKLRLREDVIFTGHVSDEELAAYYKLSDVFLMMSEHEGFCVPLIEAFLWDIPVIAFDAGAVGETMRGGGILLAKKDYAMIAELVDKLMTSNVYRQTVIASQQGALKKYEKESGNKTLPVIIERFLTGTLD
jgi:glycosyltransferase involved in cell wall biosynthesis